MDKFTITDQISAEGRLTTACVGTDTANFLISLAEVTYIPGVNEIIDAIPSFSEAAEQAGKRYIGTERNDRMFAAWQRIMKTPMRNVLNGAIRVRVEVTKELDKYNKAPDTIGALEISVRAETRALLRDSSVEQQASLIAGADYRTLAAIMDAPAIVSGLSDHLYNIAQERFRLLNVIKLTHMSPEFKLKPTLENLAAIGIDDVAAEKEARALLENRSKKLEAVDLAASTIRRMISFSGLITGKTDQEILDEILA
ncbi:hypothetical protein [Paracoccus sp. J55]|uniref:hypothetical protein n=1 Tax=Paracoccus sp. J55 TaxID=935849 RepID=UPI0012EC0ABD|nr:hypothetical protein [Paracoccus sp. J55]